MNSLNDDVFNALDKDLKEKVAQKFIENKIDITNDSVIKENLAGFIVEVKDEKKQNEISIKVGGNGKVTITKVANDETTDFDFASFEKLQGFVNALDGKYITSEKVELSFAFEGANVKICGHDTGFDITEYIEDFFKYFEDLIKIDSLNLQVSGLSLKVSGSQLTLNEVELSDDYFKNDEFWTLVKDHAAFFGITGDGKKFEIEKQSEEIDAVKIEEFVTQLKWSEVVNDEGETLKEEPKWGNIFKIKKEKHKPEEVTVEFKAEGKYSLNNVEAGLKTLENLTTFVSNVKGQTVKEKNNKKIVFSVKDGGKINVKVGELVDFDVQIDKNNFSDLLGYVKDLESVGLVEDNFKFQVKAGTDAIKFGEKGVTDGFLVSKDAWEIIKTNKGLFDLGTKGVEVEKGGGENKYVKIGTLELNFDVLDKNGNEGDCGILTDWNGVFTLKG